MQTAIFDTKTQMAQAAADKAAEILIEAITRQGHATFVAATGASQFEFLDALVANPAIDWSKTTMFHLDEYIGVSESHPASFRRYLNERLIERVQPGTVHLIHGDAPDPVAECDRINRLIRDHTVDVAFVGIGENGHLAFNDPPADFETDDPYLIVELDDACRTQQMNEGWFATLDDVPRRAISMSIKQIMAAQTIVCTVPDRRKAQAVAASLTGEISPLVPASILRQHEHATLFLDADSASLLNR